MAETNLIINSIHGAAVVDLRSPSMLDSRVIEAIDRQLCELIEQKAVRKIVLDFQSVRFMASQAIGVLLTLRKKAEQINGEIALCNVNNELMKIFEIMKLSSVFAFFDSEKAALESMGVHTE